MSDLTWKTLSSEYLFKETWFTVRKDKCEKPDGKIVDPYYVFEFPEWATGFPVTEDGKIILVKQYRQALGEVCIEIPGGCVDDTDTTPEDGIRRELLEETGYAFETVHYLGRISANPSTNTNLMHMYIALGGRKIQEQVLDHNEEIVVEMLTLDELKGMLVRNEIKQALHVSCIFYALMKMGKLAFS